MIAAITVFLVLSPTPSLHIRVDGDGYLRFARGANMLYTKSATLVPSAKGLIASDGSILVPRMMVPAGTDSLACGLDGEITADVNGSSRALGRIVIATFSTTPSFVEFGGLLSTLTKPTLTNPGEGLSGVIRPKVAMTAAKSTTAKPKANAAQPFSGASTEVRVRPESMIEGEVITLESIADIEGDPSLVKALKAVEFGKTPYFGSSRGLSLINVKANISAAQIDVRKLNITVPSGAKVSRKSQTVGLDEIDKSVVEAFKAKFSMDIDLTMKTRLVPVPIPLGYYTLEVGNIQIKDNEVSVSVDIKVNSKFYSSLPVIYSTSGISQVKRGDIVRLRMISASAKVEVSAKAQGAAYLGQRITVITDSGATQTGTLIGPSLVEVRL